MTNNLINEDYINNFGDILEVYPSVIYDTVVFFIQNPEHISSASVEYKGKYWATTSRI